MPRALPAQDAAAYVEQSLAGAFSRYEARVTLHVSAEEIQRRLPFLGGAVTAIGGERCEYRTSDDNLEWLAVRIAMLGVEAEVHEPPELRAQLQALADRISRSVQRSA
jgi:predicted DNA-binding transcriptional regulator YafY